MIAKHSLLDEELSEEASEELREVELSDGSNDDNDAREIKESIVEPVDELKTVLAAELSTDTTQYYLNQIGTRPLLTAQEELACATLAKKGDFVARQKNDRA